MRKVLAWFLIGVFLMGVAGQALAQDPAKVKAYIKLLEAKIKKAKAKAQIAKLKKLIAAEKKRLAALESGAITPPPPPPPPTTLRPPVTIVPPVAAPAGLFGLGWNTAITGTYLYTGKGLLGTLALREDLVLDDPLALGSLVGLSANAVKYRVGLGAVYGNDNNDRAIKAIPIFIDGVLNLPADVLGGIESYLGGGANYNLYGTDKASGPYGVEAYVGIQGDLGLGLGGKTTLELGYSVLRAGSANPRSSKGITISAGQQFVL